VRIAGGGHRTIKEKHGIAGSARRREDVRFLTGQGRFADDVTRDGQVYAAFVRSPVAHGTIVSINMDAATRAPGVVAVFNGDDLAAAGVGHIVARWPKYQSAQIQSARPLHTPRPGLAQGKVRHVGEVVVLVLATTLAQARDAADLVVLDIAELPAAVTIADAVTPGAPIVWDDAPGNIGLVWHRGDTNAANVAFAEAAHVSYLSLVNNRLVAAPLEPRTSIADWDEVAGRYTLVASSQGVQYFMEILCEQVFNVPRTEMRVLTGDVGGGFGVKEQPFPEDIAILFAARALSRPIKWTGTRSEHFLGDSHARDAVIEASLALDAEGNFLALRVAVDDAMGSYYACNGTGMPLRNMPNGLALVYRTPVIDIDVRLVLTHTNSVGPYRGAGREQASYIVERLVDQAARETRHDPIELRRRNMISPDQMPYATPVDRIYDSGEFEAVLDKTVALADWDGYAERRSASEQSGKLRGRGIASYLECIGGSPFEGAKVEFLDDGTVDLVVATQSQGQGHETSFIQVIAERLGLPFESVNLRQGDSDTAPRGIATIASRSMTMAGSAIAITCDAVIEKGRVAAAHLLEASAADIEFLDGAFHVTGTDRRIALLDVAAQVKMILIEDVPGTLNSSEEFTAPEQYFPNGCHVCELEIDPDTGVVTLDRYTAIDDCGVVINPAIVHGQVHGGVMQGIGQALMEEIIYDRDSGQLLTGSFMDYRMPRAVDQPQMQVDFHEVPSPTNPLGVKGVGEAGIVGALPVIFNALADALATRGAVVNFQMPATAEKVWRALNR
jgi:carbon-monoxide dehydrogenase large subunit